jgi:hypothetical protein
VVRWELGTVAPSRAAVAALWFAANTPDEFRRYARTINPDMDQAPAAIVEAVATSAEDIPAVQVKPEVPEPATEFATSVDTWTAAEELHRAFGIPGAAQA